MRRNHGEAIGHDPRVSSQDTRRRLRSGAGGPARALRARRRRIDRPSWATARARIRRGEGLGAGRVPRRFGDGSGIGRAAGRIEWMCEGCRSTGKVHFASATARLTAITPHRGVVAANSTGTRPHRRTQRDLGEVRPADERSREQFEQQRRAVGAVGENRLSRPLKLTSEAVKLAIRAVSGR